MGEVEKKQHDNIEDLRQVKGIEKKLDHKDSLHKISRDAKEVVKKVGEALTPSTEGEEDDSLKGAKRIKETLHPVSSIVGDFTDSTRIAELSRIAERARTKAFAGDYLYQQGKQSNFNFDEIKQGDLKAYQKLCKNPNLSKEKIEAIRNDPALQGRVDISNQKARKQVFELKQQVGLNMYEDNVKTFMGEHRDLFTDKHREFVEGENSMFQFGKKGNLATNKEILNTYMKCNPSFGEWRGLDFNRMDVKDIKGYLLRKDKDTALAKGVTKFRFNNIEQETGMYAFSVFKGIEKQKSNVGVGGKRTHLGGDVYSTLGFRGTEMDSHLRMVRTGVQTGKIAVKTGYRATKFTLKVSHRAVEFGGTLTAKAFDKAGNHAMANIIRKTGDNIIETERAVKKVGTDIVQYPKKKMDEAVNRTRRAISDTAKKISNSRWARKIRESKFGRATAKVGSGLKKAGGFVKKGGQITAAPFRFIGKIIDFVKKKIMLPLILVVGGWFLLLCAGSVIFTVINNNGAVVSIILDSEEHFKDFQEKYDEYEAVFQTQVNGIIDGFAQSTNKKEQQIKFGVNGSGNSEGNVNDDYSSGVIMNYTYDGAVTEGISSNIEDCLSVMAVLMQQEQEAHHAEAVELLEALYKSSHSYDYVESALYPCGSGCETTHYLCSEKEINYLNSELRFMPWLFAEVSKPTAEQECVVCKKVEGMTYAEWAGCVVTGTCYHGTDGDMGESHEGCDNYSAVYGCSGHPYDDTWTDAEGTEHGSSGTDYCTDDLGCEGYYECGGHSHYGCPLGHDIKTCFGHVDLTMNVNIASLTRLMEMGGVEVKEKGDSGDE